MPSELGLLTNLEWIGLGKYGRRVDLCLEEHGLNPSSTIVFAFFPLRHDALILDDNNLSGSVPSELFAFSNVYIIVGNWLDPDDPDSNPNLYALCGEYYDPSMIDIDCDPSRGVPSIAPSVSSSPILSSPPTTSSLSSPISTSSSAPYQFLIVPAVLESLSLSLS